MSFFAKYKKNRKDKELYNPRRVLGQESYNDGGDFTYSHEDRMVRGSSTDDLLKLLLQNVSAHGNGLRSEAKRVFTYESLNEIERGNVENSVDELENITQTVLSQTEDGDEYTPQQREAAVYGAILGSGGRETLDRVSNIPVDAEAVTSVQLGSEQSLGRRSLEAYDESENSNSMVMSLAYNLKAARQDEFGETFYPTVVVPPDTTNVEVVVDLITVFDDIKRNIDGTMEYEWGKKTLTNAMVYPDILYNDTTRNIPVYRETDPKSKAQFVDETDLKPWLHTLEDKTTVKTSALKFGTEVDLLGLGQTDELLSAGIMDSTDQLDRRIALDKLFIKTKSGQVICLAGLNNIPESSFTPTIQGQNLDMRLNYDNRWTMINGETLVCDPAKPGEFKTLKEVNDQVKAGYSIQIKLNVSGPVNLNTGYTTINCGKVLPIEVTKKQGEDVIHCDTSPTGDPEARKLWEEFDQLVKGSVVEPLGYTLEARRINSNRRERGQLVDILRERVMYSIPLLAPISMLRPVTENDVSDGQRIDYLVKTTYARCTVAAVYSLINTAKILKENVGQGQPIRDPRLVYNNKLLGAGRYNLIPYYDEIDLDIVKELNTLTSSGRIQDIQAVMINAIRAHIADAYLKSNYRSAASLNNGNPDEKPQVILGTDPFTAAYLQIIGDARTLGDGFDLKIVTTNNILIRDKMYVTFGGNAKNRTELNNPLHWGNCLYRPESVYVIQATRRGAVNKELTVQPSFLHVPHLPLLLVFDVKRLREAVAQFTPFKAHIW